MKRSPLRSVLTSAALAIALTAAREAAADTEPVDVVIHDVPPPHRLVVLEWSPLPLFAVGKLSADVILTPGDHHALVLSPFYAWTTTAPIVVFSDSGSPTQLPAQKFSGFGAELGYRYYAEGGGARGLFVGPSFIFGSFNAKAQNGSETPYVDYGLAADVGYQLLLGDRAALSLGAGVQYLRTSTSIPNQQFPAWVYANDRVSPRLLFALGWAL